MPTITENAINPAGVGNRKGTIAPTAIMQAVMTVSIFGRPIRSASGPAARQQTSPITSVIDELMNSILCAPA